MSAWTDQIRANRDAIQQIIDDALTVSQLPALVVSLSANDVTAFELDATGETVKVTLAQLLSEFAVTAVALDDITDVTITEALKGDLLVKGSTDWQDLTIGANGTTLIADSAESLGMRWGTLSVTNAESIVISVRKSTPGTILKGLPVYLVSFNVGGWYDVEQADCDDPAKMPAIGIAGEDILNNSTINLITFGTLGSMDTSAFSINDSLYVGNTGTLTSTRPTSATCGVQKLGIVTRSHVSAGVITVAGAFRVNDIPNLMSDNIFRIGSVGDLTKIVDFDLSGLTTATTRTLTVQDADGTIMLVGDAPTAHTHTFASLTSKPTTLSGYGISDTKANFDTALSDGSFLYVGDALILDQTSPQTIINGAPIFSAGLEATHLLYDTAATPIAGTPGLTQWNTTEDTLDLSANGVTYQLGQEISPLVKNQTGSDIINGTPVMFVGTLGASGRVLIQPAIGDNTIPSSYVVGLTTEDIDNGNDGHVTWFGKVRTLDTTGTPYGETWNDSDILYVSATTAGYLTNVKPEAPNSQIFIGVVVLAHATNGVIFVRPSWRGNVSDLDDVNGTTLDTDGQLMVWDDTQKYFDFNYNINNYSLTSHTHDFADLTSKPTTLAGYGISDTKTNFNTALSDGSFIFVGDAPTAHNHAWGDITSGVPTTLAGYGISDTKTNFNTALSDGSFMYIGDAPTAHTHLLAAGATDVTATFGELNLLDLAGLTIGWVLSADSATTASWKAPTGGGSGGTEIIDETNGDGLVITGRVAANYGNVGEFARDLSHSTSASSTKGATGQYSVAFGKDNTASGLAALSGGVTCDVAGNESIGWGLSNTVDSNLTFVFGRDLIVNAQYSLIGGFDSTVTSSASLVGGTGHSVTGDSNMVSGVNNSLAGFYAVTLGRGCVADSMGEVQLGLNPTTYTRNAADGSTFHAADRALTVGIGDTVGDVHADGIILLKSGEFNLPKYGVNTFTGTATYALAVDAAGKVIEVALGGGGSPLTTKGDIFTYDTGDQRLAVSGNNGWVLSEDSTEPTGLKWVVASGGASALSDLTDVVSATNTNRFVLVANGTTGYVGRALLEADISDLQSYYLASNPSNYIDNTNVAFTNVDNDFSVEQTITKGITGADGAVPLLTLDGTEITSDLLAGDGVGILFKIPYTGNISQIGASISAVKFINADGDSSTDLVFSISQDDEILDEAMRIDYLGDVAMGTPNPSFAFGSGLNIHRAGTSELHLSSDAGTSNFYIANFATASGTVLGNSGTVPLRFYVGTEVMRIQPDGSVGIGTITPSHELDIESASTTTAIQINNTASGDAYTHYLLDGVDEWSTGIDFGLGNAYVISDTNGLESPRMTILQSGNVGIGTTTPYAYDTTPTKFHVKNDGGAGVLAELARFQGSSDADGSGAIVRIGTSNDRGIYIEGGRTSSVEYGIIGVTDFNGVKTEAININNLGNATFSGTLAASNLSGSNSGDQTTIVGITGTKAQFDTAVTDGNFMYIGDAPTAHIHDSFDRATSVESGATVFSNIVVADGITTAIATRELTASDISALADSVTMAQLDTAVSDGNVAYQGETVVVGDHGTAATDEVVNVCYGTSATPPSAGTTTEGALYIQYTA